MALPNNNMSFGMFVEHDIMWNEMRNLEEYVLREGETADERDERMRPTAMRLWEERKQAWKKVWDTKVSEHFPKLDVAPFVADEERQRKSEEWIINKSHRSTRARVMELIQVNGLDSGEAFAIVDAEEEEAVKIDLVSMAQGIDFGADLDEIEKYEKMCKILEVEYNNWTPSEISIR